MIVIIKIVLISKIILIFPESGAREAIYLVILGVETLVSWTILATAVSSVLLRHKCLIKNIIQFVTCNFDGIIKCTQSICVTSVTRYGKYNCEILNIFPKVHQNTLSLEILTLKNWGISWFGFKFNTAWAEVLEGTSQQCWHWSFIFWHILIKEINSRNLDTGQKRMGLFLGNRADKVCLHLIGSRQGQAPVICTQINKTSES